MVVIEGAKTGRRRYRIGWFNKVVLQVECEQIVTNLMNHLMNPKGNKPDGPHKTFWRDAYPAEVGLPTVLLSTPTFLSIAHGGGVIEKTCEKE